MRRCVVSASGNARWWSRNRAATWARLASRPAASASITMCAMASGAVMASGGRAWISLCSIARWGCCGRWNGVDMRASCPPLCTGAESVLQLQIAKKQRPPKVPLFWSRMEKAVPSVFDEGFLALPLPRRQQHDDEQQCRSSQQACRQRTRNEHAPVATRQQQRAAQVLFHHRAQDEAQQQRCGFGAQLVEDVAHQP